MLSVERREKILEKLREEKHVAVGELSRLFGVSEETIRRDMDRLEQEGLLTRTYGGAVYNDDGRQDLPYEIRKRSNVEAKQRIARAVADMIRDGDCIMLDESSTCTYVAVALKNAGRKNLTLVTNSVEILTQVFEEPSWNVFSTGGLLKTNTLSFTGHQAENMVRSYHVNVTVISCTGLDINAGYTDNKEDTAHLKRSMMSVAKRTVLAVDSGKFERIAFAGIGNLNELDTLVTEKDPGEEWRTALGECGVTLKIAE